MKEKFKGAIGKILVFLAVVMLLALLLKIDFVRYAVSKVTGVAGDVLDDIANKAVPTVAAVSLVFVAVAIGAALPLVAVALAVVAVAILAFTWWGAITKSTMPKKASIGSQTDSK